MIDADPRASRVLTQRLALSASPDAVHRLLSTRTGRERFWAESAPEVGGSILFTFPDGTELAARVLETVPGRLFSCRYFGDSIVTFELAERPGGGCLVTLTEHGGASVGENAPGWVSVLLNLKAVADHGVDLRNHDRALTWREGYVDN
jgi:uncharacterized protein YndB with AHSA1/START domain